MSLGSKAEIAVTPETEAVGLAARKGVIYGFTTPSHSNVDVIGQLADDFALSVYFEELDESYWFAEELVIQLDDGEGTVVSLAGSANEFVKTENGGWIECSTWQVQRSWVNWFRDAMRKRKAGN